MKKEAKQQPKHPVWKKISAVLTILLLTVVLACVVSVVTSKYIYHQPAALFGYRIVHILTDSMSPEIDANSYVLVKNIDGNKVKEGDVVVHVPAYGPYAGVVMTHRCVKAPYFDEAHNQMCILTQGTKDGAPVDEPVPVVNIQSVYIRTIGVGGGFFDFVTSIWGIMVLVALPSLGAVIWQMVIMIRAVHDKPDEEAVHEEAQRIEAERRQQLQQEMMDDLAAQQDVLAFIAAQQQQAPADAPKPKGEMADVLAFIAAQKAAANAGDDTTSADSAPTTTKKSNPSDNDE